MLSKKSGLDVLIATAIERARAENRRVLVSLTEKIDELDALAALESLSVAPVVQELPGSGMIYWERPADDFSMAGLGAAWTFEHGGSDRFANTEAEWRSLLEGAIVEPPVSSTGTGPVIMGGFSFDPAGPRTSEWNALGSSHLVIPALLITSKSGESWVTMNVVLSPGGNTHLDPAALGSAAESVSAVSGQSPIDIAAAAPIELSIESLSTRGEWQEMVRTAVTEIRSGDLSKVVVARAVRVSAPDTIDVFALLRHLRSIHRESFVFGVWQSDSAFVGASPERLVRVTGSEVEASSLAGTIERGATPSEDADNAHLLRESTKDLAEHVAVRDELISALSERCDDVRAADTPSLLTLPNVHHLHTPIRARLRSGDSLLSLVGALHPTPAVGGLPRDVALEFIEDHEGLDRGWYAAPVGWIGGQSGEFAVALRSALVDGNHAVLYAGCGIVAESDPDLEYAESNLKLKAMLSAIAASASASPDHAAATAALEHSS